MTTLGVTAYFLDLLESIKSLRKKQLLPRSRWFSISDGHPKLEWTRDPYYLVQVMGLLGHVFSAY